MHTIHVTHTAAKRPVVSRDDLAGYRRRLLSSAQKTQSTIVQLAATANPLTFLAQLKFEKTGCDPLNPSQALNLIEQLNQTFTYLASFEGAAFLFSQHPYVQTLSVNLGTAPGSDIESTDAGGIAAEVFASVTPKNNRKLAKDIEKVACSDAKHRYVLFMSPGCTSGPYPVKTATRNVCVWSLGYPPELSEVRHPC